MAEPSAMQSPLAAVAVGRGRWGRRLSSGVLPPAGPGRRLMLISLVDSMGTGAFLSASTVFFTRVVHLTAAQVGLGLSVAGVVAFAASVLFGRLADRTGPKPTVLGLNLGLAGLFTGYLFVHSFWPFLALVCLVAAGMAGVTPVTGALIYALLPAEQRVRVAAYRRAVFNVGWTAGALGAAIALRFDSAPAYHGLVIGDAVSYLLVAALVATLPATRPARRPGDRLPRWAALNDLPFVTLTGISAVMLFTEALYGVGIPLWVLHHTQVPKWVIAAVIMESSVLVALLQVRTSRDVHTPAQAGTAIRYAGVLLAAGCVPLAFSYHQAGTGAALLLLGGLFFVGGEMLQAAGGWALTYTLPPAGLQGSYQGVYGLAFTTQSAVGPYLCALLLVSLGLPGWFILAGCFLTAGLLAPPVTRWATANRPTALPEPPT